MSNESKEESKSIEENLYPEKPKNHIDFKKAVAWFGGRELVASLKGVLLYAIFGENIDPRSWMNANIYPNVLEKVLNKNELEARSNLERELKPEDSNNKILYSEISRQATKNLTVDTDVKNDISVSVEQDWAKKIFDQWQWKRDNYKVWESFSNDEKFWQQLQPVNQSLDEFWFDYIADSGDGQLGVYNVACLCLSDLWLDKASLEKAEKSENTLHAEVSFLPPEQSHLNEKIILPRGAFLFVGGDTAYHASSYATLVERFQHPFRWAFTSVREFAEKHYGLKQDKKNLPVTAETAKERYELPGSLPGRVNDVEYSDTEPMRPLFGIPGNHDYYDSIDGFNRLFRHPPFENVEENMVFNGKRGKFLLQIPTFSRKQEASYVAIRLPFEWWMFAIDGENEKLDFRQEFYFTGIIEQKPKKLILATPEPTTVFGRKALPEEKTAGYLKSITEALGLCQPFLVNGKLKPLDRCPDKSKKKSVEKDLPKPDSDGAYCRLDLSGDVHHYARYWGEDTKKFGLKTDKFHSENYASVVAGGGGAFFDVTKTLLGKPLDEHGKPIFDDPNIHGEIPPQSVFPSIERSVDETADKLFDLWNIRRGGYVQHAGFAIAAILFYFLTYFSNVSFVLKDHSGFKFANYWKLLDKSLFASLALFIGAAVSLIFSAVMVTKLIQSLKEKNFKNAIDKKSDGGILQLAYCYLPFIAGVPLYFYALANIYDNWIPNQPKAAIDNFLISCNLLVNFLLFVLLLWLSSEHTNWLLIRFKVFRKFKIKSSSQTVEDSNEKAGFSILTLVGKLSRLYSYQYVLSNALILAAIGLLVTGFNTFGAVSISRTLADTTLIVVIVGMLIVVVYFLAISTGAAYHRTFLYKYIYFGVIGVVHYAFQIFTPLILFFYGSWKYLLVNFLLVGLFNGSVVFSYAIKHFFVDENNRSIWDKIAGFKIGAWLTKRLNKYFLFLFWITYGITLNVVAFNLSPQNSVYNSIKTFFSNYSENFYGYAVLKLLMSNFFNVTPQIFDAQFTTYCTIWASILVIGYIGFLMSRVWLGWYLAVTMQFDGHNNEVGGAARIEGFKHILRVKVEKEKLTVYVIGFDEAKSEMSELDLRLVDKFTLKCSKIL